jgi:signal transduction histidine kinase
VKIEHDILTDDDRELLHELAVRLLPHAGELAAEWAEAWERGMPCAGVDPTAYRQVLDLLTAEAVSSVMTFLAARDFEGLYEFQYRNNREGARRQLRRGAMPIFAQRELHHAARLGQPLMAAWIDRLFGEDRVLALRVQLAQERLGSQLDGLLSEAYSDEREGHLQALGDRLERALRLSERLRLLGQTIATSLEVDPVVDIAMRAALELLGGDSCGLTLANPEGTAVQLRRLLGAEQSDVGRWASVDGSLSGWVFRNDCVARSDRPLPSLGERTRAAIERLGIRAFLMAPLRAAGRPIGALGVSWHRERTFTSEKEHLLQSLAHAVAPAIENARAHGEVRGALRAAERANHAKSEFVAAVSHEIRSPLSALLGYADLLRDEALGPATTEQREAFTRMQAVARGTLRLTDDLLEHARLESGVLPVRMGEVRVTALLAEAAEHARMLIGARRIEVTTTSAVEVECVQADPDRLRQILVNLVSNAVKFTPEGTVQLTVRRSSREAMIEIGVRDTGIGIHPRDLPHVFDLFYRAPGSAEAAPGAGIGLFLSRALARAMGGELSAESEPGRGAAFTLTLRAA